MPDTYLGFALGFLLLINLLLVFAEVIGPQLGQDAPPRLGLNASMTWSTDLYNPDSVDRSVHLEAAQNELLGPKCKLAFSYIAPDLENP